MSRMCTTSAGFKGFLHNPLSEGDIFYTAVWSGVDEQLITDKTVFENININEEHLQTVIASYTNAGQ
jgi:hypothetical protein